MAISDADIEFAKELFADVGPLTTRKMMGGLCLYSDGVIFAIIHSDARIYLKATGTYAETLVDMGAEQGSYTRDTGKVTKMPYWTLPDAALDDPTTAGDLARTALSYLE